MTKRYKHLVAQVDADTEARTETFFGQEYLVIPVIAMVEGVRFGANSGGSGELGLSEEFGKVPDGWNSKPVVLNHPQLNGVFVSANSPAVLETYYMGLIMHTKLQGKKLSMEAWINTELRDQNEAYTEMFERIESNEVIEVSVGMFTDLEEVSGEYDGIEYEYIWRNIVPDHLALLEAGTIGACSVEDGCGTHRAQMIAQNKEIDMPIFRADKAKKAKVVNSAEEAACSCQTPATQEEDSVVTDSVENEAIQAFSQHLGVFEVAEGLTYGDVWQSLNDAVSAYYSNEDENRSTYMATFTSEHVVYETYSTNERRWVLLQMPYSINADGAVTFTGDPEEIRMMTRIVKVESDNLNLNQGNKEDDMSIKANEEGQATVEGADAPATDATTETTETTETVETTAETPVAEAEVTANSKPQTVQEYIQNAPEGIRDVLDHSYQVHQSAKATAITALKATNRCKFSDEKLNGMTLQELQDLQELAQVPSYEGRAVPVQQNTAEDDAIPAAPTVSERLKAQAANA